MPASHRRCRRWGNVRGSRAAREAGCAAPHHDSSRARGHPRARGRSARSRQRPRHRRPGTRRRRDGSCGQHRSTPHAYRGAAGGGESELPLDSPRDDRAVSDAMSEVISVDWRDGATSLTHLHAGDAVELTGRVLTLRDASAARLARAIAAREALPVSLEGQILYAVGPSPPKPGQIIGSAGPTTTARMSRYFAALFDVGVGAVIGKGELHGEEMTAFTQRGV